MLQKCDLKTSPTCTTDASTCTTHARPFAELHHTRIVSCYQLDVRSIMRGNRVNSFLRQRLLRRITLHIDAAVNMGLAPIYSAEDVANWRAGAAGYDNPDNPAYVYDGQAWNPEVTSNSDPVGYNRGRNKSLGRTPQNVLRSDDRRPPERDRYEYAVAGVGQILDPLHPQLRHNALDYVTCSSLFCYSILSTNCKRGTLRSFGANRCLCAGSESSATRCYNKFVVWHKSCRIKRI